MYVIAQERVAVFQSGADGYRSFRIPAIIKFQNQLLAFAEGRVHGAGDFGNIDIVMKRSRDLGRTWSTLQVVVDADSLQAGNPAPVVDFTDPRYPNGRIFLFYNTGNNTEQQVRLGHGLREAWYITSVDGGAHWSSPVNITSQVHRPKQPVVHGSYDFIDDWRSYANTPGHATQFRQTPYRGRIYVAANHSAGPPREDFSDYQAHGYYTDDHGKTFHLSESVSIPGSNESVAAVLPGGRLVMNSRNQRGDIKARIVSFSNDGGASWDSSYFDMTLPDPVCQGSLVEMKTGDGKVWLVFSNNADTVQRNQLTVRVSRDHGITWSRGQLVEKGSSVDVDHTAYSDLAWLRKTDIGILYERADYSEIAFRLIRIDPGN